MRARAWTRTRHALDLFKSFRLSFALSKSQGVGSRAQEGSHLAIGATKAPLAVFERARSAHKKKAKEEGSHLAIGATKAPIAVFMVVAEPWDGCG